MKIQTKSQTESFQLITSHDLRHRHLALFVPRLSTILLLATLSFGIMDRGPEGLRIYQNYPTRGIVISSNGFVGIGNLTPNATLDVAGTVSASAIIINGNWSAATYSGIWQGSAVAVSYGGSGATTLTGVLKGNGTTAFTGSASLDDIAEGTTYKRMSATNYTDLTDAGDSTLHYHATDRALTNATGTLAVANGGTGQTALSSVTVGSATTAGNVTGVVAVANGGTGATTLTGVLKGNGTTAFTGSASLDDIAEGTTYKRMSATNYTDLTDAGDSTLHYHATDRALTNATGTLAVANGGTGATTLGASYLVKGNGASALSSATIYDTGTNIGIGDTTPTAKLSVAGSISGNNGLIINAGTVGIGISNPAEKLEVNGNILADAKVFAQGGFYDFGDGSDGSFSSVGNFTQSGFCQYNNFTLNAGHTMTLGNQSVVLYVSGTLTLAGNIVGTGKGANANEDGFCGGGAGGAGGGWWSMGDPDTTGPGSPATDVVGTMFSTFSGGSANAAECKRIAATKFIGYGAGGGNGGGAAGGAGGAGGAGLLIVARNVVFSGSPTIISNGNPGGFNQWYGSGGGGGCVVLLYHAKSGSNPTITTSGGSGGSGYNGGPYTSYAGAAGGSGSSLIQQI